jgi:uncharacterized membrane protein
MWVMAMPVVDGKQCYFTIQPNQGCYSGFLSVFCITEHSFSGAPIVSCDVAESSVGRGTEKFLHHKI